MQSRAPSTGIGRAGKRLGMLTGYTKPICKQSWTRLKKKNESGPVYMGTAVITEVASSDE